MRLSITTLGLTRGGAGEPPIITATVAPAAYSYSDGDTVGDHPNFATLDTTGNYASTAGTISTVEWLVDGTDRASSYVLSAGEAVVVRVTDSAANTRDWTVDASVAAVVPDAFTSGDWSVASGGSTVTITTLPDDGGSALTDIEYRVNSGSAVSLGETTTGTYSITASDGDDVEIRAVNSVGAGAWSDTKTVSSVFDPDQLFASGEEGWNIPATTSDTFRAPNNLTLSTTTQSSGFALDISEGTGYSGGAFTGLESELFTNGTFDTDLSGWTVDGAGWYWDSGTARIDGPTPSGTDETIEQTVTVESGVTYLTNFEVVIGTAGAGDGNVSWSGDIVGTLKGSNTRSAVVVEQVADTDGTSLKLSSTAKGPGLNTGMTIAIDDISARKIPGAHGSQTNASFQPILQAAGLDYDGIDDRLSTLRSPTTAGTLVARFNGDTASRVVMGSQGASDGRAFLALDASGRLAAGIGTQSTATIFGGSDIRGVESIGAVTWDGTTVKLYLDGTEVYSAAQSGAVNTTVAMHLGALNANGTASAFWDGIIGQSIAIDRALTSSEISDLTTFWST